MLLNLLIAFLSLASGASAWGCTHDTFDDALVSTDSYGKLDLNGQNVQTTMQNRQIDLPIHADGLGLYFVNISIGSNKQIVSLQLDTGSHITWVNPDCSGVPYDSADTKAECFARPRYDLSSSNTAKVQDRTLNVTYDTGDVLGTYVKDDIRVGSLVAKHALFGVAAASSERAAGILGLGARLHDHPPTIIDTLVAQGQIAGRMYSIDLGSSNKTGTLILGGIDKKKYETLTKVPSSHFRADLTNIGMTLPNATTTDFPPSLWRPNTSSLPILFDSGTPPNLLPNELYFAIGKVYPDAIPYTHPRGFPAFKVPCDAPAGTFDYTFGKYTIKISFADSLHKDSAGTCSFGFSLRPHDEWEVPYVLGATFMRGAYMVFDLDNDEIWMGRRAD